MKPSSKNNPIHHTQKIKARIRQLIDHLREDVGKVTAPKAQALFWTFKFEGFLNSIDFVEKPWERNRTTLK